MSRQYRLTGGTLFSACPSVRPSIRPFRCFENKQSDFNANWHKWSPGWWHEVFDFSGQGVKGRSQRTPKSDLEAWRRQHILNPLGSSSFSSHTVIVISRQTNISRMNLQTLRRKTESAKNAPRRPGVDCRSMKEHGTKRLLTHVIMNKYK